MHVAFISSTQKCVGYVMPGQAPMQPSQHYGGFGGQFQQNVFSINAAQV